MSKLRELAAKGSLRNAENIKLYTDLVKRYGIDVRSLNWGSVEGQRRRFAVLAESGDWHRQRILDVGCGLGDLYAWSLEENLQLAYTGIDLTPQMIEAAQQRFPGVDFLQGDALDAIAELPKFDYIISSGIFTYHDEKFLQRFVQSLFPHASTALVFNALSAQASDQEAGEFYADPQATLEFCQQFTPQVKLREDYHPRDFTIYMYQPDK